MILSDTAKRKITMYNMTFITTPITYTEGSRKNCISAWTLTTGSFAIKHTSNQNYTLQLQLIICVSSIQWPTWWVRTTLQEAHDKILHPCSSSNALKFYQYGFWRACLRRTNFHLHIPKNISKHFRANYVSTMSCYKIRKCFSQRASSTLARNSKH